MRAPKDTSDETMASVRLPTALIEQVDEVRRTLPHKPSRHAVLQRVFEVGWERFRALVEEGVEVHRPPERHGNPPTLRRPPVWERELRELHAAGLTNDEIATRMGTSPGNVRKRLYLLRLSAN